MRYAKPPSGLSTCQARSRRIGRCVRCHAPVLADEEHYEAGAGVVHGACVADSVAPGGPTDPGVDSPAPSPDALRLDYGWAARPRRIGPSGVFPISGVSPVSTAPVTVLAGSSRRA
jgi:hypothetical protein